jgi:hypothetical protein
VRQRRYAHLSLLLFFSHAHTKMTKLSYVCICIYIYIHKNKSLSFQDRVERLDTVRNHLVLLWSLAHTSIVRRSVIWLLYCEPTFLHIAACEYEATSLWQELNLKPLPHYGGRVVSAGGGVTVGGGYSDELDGIYNNAVVDPRRRLSSSKYTVKEATKSTYTDKWERPFHLRLVEMLEVIERRQAPPALKKSRRESKKSVRGSFTMGSGSSLSSLSSGSNSGYSGVDLVAEERKALYLRLKDAQKQGQGGGGGGGGKSKADVSSFSSNASEENGVLTESLFAKFNLTDKKKRKQTLSELVWSEESDPEASAQVYDIYIYIFKRKTHTCTHSPFFFSLSLFSFTTVLCHN